MEILQLRHAADGGQAVQIEVRADLILQQNDLEPLLLQLFFINVDSQPLDFFDQIFELCARLRQFLYVAVLKIDLIALCIKAGQGF